MKKTKQIKFDGMTNAPTEIH